MYKTVGFKNTFPTFSLFSSLFIATVGAVALNIYMKEV